MRLYKSLRNINSEYEDVKNPTNAEKILPALEQSSKFESGPGNNIQIMK